MATVAIGDIHGHLDALEDLLAKVFPTLSQKDTVVFLGDYIDKGPKVRECVDYIIRLKREAPCPVVALLGNHEQYMLRTLADHSAHSWIWIGGFETIESYSKEAAALIRAEFEAAGQRMILEKVLVNYGVFFEAVPASHLEFFRELKTYHETEDVICVHAGIDPAGGPMNLQDSDVLVWGTDRFPGGYNGQRPVVYGHWETSASDEAGRHWPCVIGNRTYGIDTISQGILTAMRFPDGEIWQSARKG